MIEKIVTRLKRDNHHFWFIIKGITPNAVLYGYFAVYRAFTLTAAKVNTVNAVYRVT